MKTQRHIIVYMPAFDITAVCSNYASAPTSLLWLSGRASGLVPSHFLSYLLAGATRIFLSE